MHRLTGREKRILLMRYFRNMSQAEIGAELHVSQMQVSRLLSQILERPRHRLGVAG
ncbi:RNA polymerase sigma factor (sigma-70 family) [Catenulispora sp. MAP5-51]|uniref:sigma-70 family RNA polymerase sigma factor n=1 Tax=Catenulispora sp. MAP5-51 TaxID=3156298 RepID=UPI0035167470